MAEAGGEAVEEGGGVGRFLAAGFEEEARYDAFPVVAH